MRLRIRHYKKIRTVMKKSNKSEVFTRFFFILFTKAWIFGIVGGCSATYHTDKLEMVLLTAVVVSILVGILGLIGFVVADKLFSSDPYF